MDNTRTLETILNDTHAYSVMLGREVTVPERMAFAMRNTFAALTPPIHVAIWSPLNTPLDDRGMVVVVRITPFVIVNELSGCDVCHGPIEDEYVDGKTIFGPWANMCLSCHATIGVGLGTGKGQKYSITRQQKIAG